MIICPRCGCFIHKWSIGSDGYYVHDQNYAYVDRSKGFETTIEDYQGHRIDDCEFLLAGLTVEAEVGSVGPYILYTNTMPR